MASKPRQLSAVRLYKPAGISGSRRGDGVGVVFGPAHQLPRQHGEVVNAVEAERLDHLVGLATDEIDGHGAVGQRSREPADQRDGTGGERGEAARLVVVADIAQHGAATAMAGVQDPPKLFIVAQEAVGLVDQQTRPKAFDNAEDAARRAVGRRQRPEDQTAEDIEQSRFSAAFHRRRDAQSRRDHEPIEQIRVRDPQRDRVARDPA